MYNLRRIKGTLKGRVGEVIFLSLNKYAHGTSFDSCDWFDKMTFIIPETMQNFLKKYWATIDAFEFVVEDNVVKNLILYEVKTVNHYMQGINYGNKPVLTLNAAECYRKGLARKYVVKSVSVILFDQWNFDVSIVDYNEDFYRIYSGNPLYAKQ